MRLTSMLILPAVLLVCALGSAPVRAERATPEEMELVCENWLAYMVHEKGEWAGSAEPRIREVHELLEGDTLLALVFSLDPGGYAAVPVLKDLPPIKAYSEKYRLDAGGDEGFPELLREVLISRLRLFADTYGSLDALQPAVGEVVFDRAHHERWDLFLASPHVFRARLDQGALATLEGVGPLLTSSWHQEAPYYNICPLGDGGRCLVGCVATATAQVLRYHEWPPSGEGDKSYYWNGDQSCGGNVGGGWLYADFSDPYDWANMPDSCDLGCSEEERDALAELCYEVAVSVSMDFGRCGSGTYTYYALYALPDYFRYDPSIDREFRSSHTPTTWFNLVKEEINADRPMLYRIYGHAIVCDGWQEEGTQDEYHINYGWGGPFTSWYAVDNIHCNWPGCDPMEEYMIRRIMPAPGLVFLVQPDGTGDFPTIQDAIDAAVDGCTIELADGVFTGTGNRDIDFLGKAITVRSASGDAGACIIDCEGLSRGFTFQSGEGAGSVLEGVTIAGGLASGPEPTSPHGGAVYCHNASPTISLCLMTGNRADLHGGAVFCSGSSPTFSGCTVSGNYAGGFGGGLYGRNGSSLTFDHAILWGNCAGSVGGELYLSDFACVAGFECSAVDASGIAGMGSVDWVGENVFEDPWFCGPADCEDAPTAAGEYTVIDVSPCLPENSPPTCDLIGALGMGCYLSAVAPGETGLPRLLDIVSTAPNPFNPSTTITYAIPAGDAARAVLRVYDPSGRPVRTLVDRVEEPGVYTVRWDGRDGEKARVASGVYFCRLSCRGESRTLKLVMVK